MISDKNVTNDSVLTPINRINFKFYSIALVLFTTAWVSSNIAAVKLISFFGITLTGGFVIFPFTTMFGNIISEVYGYKSARQAIWMGVTVNIVFITSLYLVYSMPNSPLWNMDDQFKNILLPSIRIVGASIISYFISEFVNSYIIAKLKIYNKGKSLFRRIFVSCAISFSLDIVLFLILAFYGVLSNNILVTLILYAYLKKIICQLALYPITFIIINHLKRKEGFDLYDYETDFNPFLYDNAYDIHSLAAHVAHDIRSPLAVMQLTVSGMKQTISQDQFEMINSSIQTVRDIANNLLAQCRKPSDQSSEENLKITPLAELLKQLVRDKNQEWSAKPCSLTLSITRDAENITLNIDMVSLKRVLSNLLNNAYEALTTQREIKISLAQENNQIMLTIQDSGSGIPPHLINDVLHGKSLKENGHGIGLSSSKKFIDKIKGKFELTSEIGFGTVVKIVLNL